MSGVCFIDTETLGLDPEIHPIWEIAVIVDGVEHCWQQRLSYSDGRHADPYATKLTRFDERYDHGAAMQPADSLMRLSELVQGRHWVGAVPSFDEERVRRAWVQWVGPQPERWPWHYHLICVETLATGWLAAKGVELPLPWDSDELTRCLGLEPPVDDQRHTALADARWAKAIYERIVH